MNYRAINVVIAIVLLISCEQKIAEGDKFSLDTANKEIEERLRTYEDLLAKGDAEGLAQIYAKDAEILHDGRPSTKGRENIKEAFSRMVRDSITSSSFKTTGLWGNNELLVEQGSGFFAHTTGKWKSNGTYLLIWKKVDGEWQIFRDTWFDTGE